MTHPISDPTYRAHIRSVPMAALDAALDAFAAERPAEAAWRAAWPKRCDAAGLGSLRRRVRTGEALRDLAMLEAAEARRSAERGREQAEALRRALARVLRQQGAAPGAVDRVGRARAYLDACPAAVRGRGRSMVVWRTVLLVVRGFALEEGEAMGVLGAYARRAAPPVRESELRGMVRRALRATSPPWGARLAEGR
jgi:hypothetical protein